MSAHNTCSMPVIRLKRNRDCDGPIDRRQPFKGSHMFGTWENGLYVVYSYGRHFPMVVYDPSPCAWFHNSDRYSNSTSRHQTYAGRRGEPKNTDTLKRLIGLGGVTAMVNHIPSPLAPSAPERLLALLSPSTKEKPL